MGNLRLEMDRQVGKSRVACDFIRRAVMTNYGTPSVSI